MDELHDRIDNLITDVWNTHRAAENLYDVRMLLQAYNGLTSARDSIANALADQKVRVND